LDTVEKAVLNGLTAEMRHPDVIAELRTYHKERKRLSAEADATCSRLERQLVELTGDIDRLVDAIAKGHGNPEVLGPRSTALYEEKKRIRAELDAAPPPTEVIALHPAVLARYEEQLTNLQEALARGARAGDSECAEAIRDLVDTVTVFRDTSKSGGVEVEIVGRLTALLGEEAYPNGVRGVWGKMVAEEGFEPRHTDYDAAVHNQKPIPVSALRSMYVTLYVSD
jgi:site-specific DNA recombinase